MPDIPPEIWYRVAHFVPDEDLCHLLGVNNVFFDLGMDLRWKDVSIETRNTSGAMRILNRLSDPYVARRLQHLRLRLTHVKERHTEGSRENAKDFKHYKQQFYLIVNRVFKLKRNPGELDTLALALGKSDPRHPRPKFNEVMDAVIGATPQFVNVTELTIDSWDLPPSYGNLNNLFTSFWRSFGANLQLLSLGGNVEGYRVLIESNPCLKQLKELRVEFTNNVFRVDDAADTAILVDTVAPFINSLNPRLMVLEILSWANLDLSLFFKRLIVPPVLRHLYVRMAFNRTLADPSGLKQLLCDGSETLEELDLRLNPSGLPSNAALEEPLSQWLAHCIEDNRCFAKLRHLDIYPTNTPAGIDVLLASIQRASKTLVHLTVRDRYLQPSETSLVLEAASRCTNLTHLRMNVRRLNVALLDTLSTMVPWIEHLWLSLGEALSINENGELGHNFLRDIQERRYMNWKLKDISVWQGGQDIDRETMEALAKSIPSITSFFGKGHTDLL